jgi:hypothetical protein
MSAVGVVMDDLGMLRSSLDDVFLTLTGHSADPNPAHSEKAELATTARTKGLPCGAPLI